MSNEHIGRLRAIGLGKESTPGTGVAPTFWIPFMQGDMAPVVTKAQDTGAYNVIEELRDSETTKVMTETSLTAIMRDDWIGLLLLGIFGQVSTGTVSGSVKDHTFTVAENNTHPSFTVVKKTPVAEERSVYSLFDSIEIDAAVGDFVKVTVKLKGKKVGTTTGSSISYPSTSNDFLAKHASVKIAPTSAGLSGATAVAVTRFKLTIEKNVVDYQAFGDNDVASFFNQQFTVKGDFEILYNAVYYRDAVIANSSDSKKAIEFKLTNTDITIGGSYNPTLTFTMYQAALTTWSETNDNNQLVRQTIGYECEYNVAASAAIQAVLRNLTASY